MPRSMEGKRRKNSGDRRRNIPPTELIVLVATMLVKGLDQHDGHYHYENNDGTSKIIVDPEQCAQEIHTFIYE